MALMDWIQSITAEAWHWVLPSNRFSSEPGPSFSDLVVVRTILQEYRDGTLTTKACVEELLDRAVPLRLRDQAEGAGAAAPRLLTSMLQLLAGREQAQVVRMDRFNTDGGGSGKGFGVVAVKPIPFATTVDNIFGFLIPIPERYTVNNCSSACEEV